MTFKTGLMLVAALLALGTSACDQMKAPAATGQVGSPSKQIGGVPTGTAAKGARSGLPCAVYKEYRVRFSSPDAEDTLTIETVGSDCATGKVLTSLRVPDGRVLPLMISDVTQWGDLEAPETFAQGFSVITVEDSTKGSELETWAELEKAGTQPNGDPWRGTSLSKAEYERLFKAKPRTLTVSVDPSRFQLYVWDSLNNRPVEYVYYGD